MWGCGGVKVWNVLNHCIEFEWTLSGFTGMQGRNSDDECENKEWQGLLDQPQNILDLALEGAARAA